MLTVLLDFKCDICQQICTRTEKEPPDGWIQLNKPTREFEDRFVHVCAICAGQIITGCQSKTPK